MRQFIANLSIHYKTALFSFLASVVVFLGLIFGCFVGLHDLPNGLALGAIVGIIPYIVLGILDKNATDKKKLKWEIAVTIGRFILIGGAIALVGYLTYNLEYRIFNIFTLIGGYFISLITYVILVLRENKNV